LRKLKTDREIKGILITKASLAFIVMLIFLLLGAAPSQAAFKPITGECLNYNVSWAGIHIGKVQIRVIGAEMDNGKVIYHLRQDMQSNPLLFFVNLKSCHDTWIDENFLPQKFMIRYNDDSTTYRAEYTFDYADSLLDVNIERRGLDSTHKLQLPDKIYDGLGLIFFVRSKAQPDSRDTVWSISEENMGRVVYKFDNKIELISMSAQDEKQPALHMSGRFLFKGIAGLSGGYEGWFSADERRIPLRAKLKIFLGSIRLELVESLYAPFVVTDKLP
jgi:hypothetical protein